MSKQHFLYIDRLKGFAILLVVMGHIGLFPMHPTDTSIFRIISSFHMPLFMFISGWIVSIPQTKTDIKRKAIKYLIPFLFFGILFSLYIKDSLTFPNLISSFNFFFSESKYGYWYFFSLALFYPTLIFNKNNKNGNRYDILIPCLIYILFYIGWKKTTILSNILCLEHAVCFYPFYILGVLVRKYEIIELILNQNKIFTSALFLYIGLMVLEPIYLPHVLYTIISRFLIPLLAIIVCVYIFVIRENKKSKIENQLALWGRNTLSIYAIHYFFIYKINLETTCNFFNSGNNTFILLLFILVISIIIIYSSIYAGYLIKTSNWIRKWIYSER